MKILAMDTSSSNATVALADNGKLTAEYTISSERAHSQIIMPMAEDILSGAHVSVKDIDVFAVALGPGSFTGLRIGIAAMKTLASTLDKKIIGISSLDCVAESFAYGDKYIGPIFDARRNDVYNAIYDCSGKKIVQDRCCDFDELLIEMSDKNVIFAGDAIYKYKNKIESFEKHNWCIAPLNLSTQRASSVASLAYKRALNNDFDNIMSVAPIYLRLPQAEREYNLIHGIK